MAGKSSLFNALRWRAPKLTHPEHGRTIGLDIGRLEQLTELQFEEGNPGLDPALGKVRLPAYYALTK